MLNYDKESIFTFGKYKGLSLENILEKDPKYIWWAAYNKIINISNELTEIVLKSINTKNFFKDSKNSIEYDDLNYDVYIGINEK